MPRSASAGGYTHQRDVCDPRSTHQRRLVCVGAAACFCRRCAHTVRSFCGAAKQAADRGSVVSSRSEYSICSHHARVRGAKRHCRVYRRPHTSAARCFVSGRFQDGCSSGAQLSPPSHSAGVLKGTRERQGVSNGSSGVRLRDSRVRSSCCRYHHGSDEFPTDAWGPGGQVLNDGGDGSSG